MTSDSNNEVRTAVAAQTTVEAAKDEVMPFDGPLHDDSNYTGYIQLIGSLREMNFVLSRLYRIATSYLDYSRSLWYRWFHSGVQQLF